MRRKLVWIVSAGLIVGAFSRPSAAQYAVEVISYVPGLNPAPGYIIPAAALGSPERFTGEGVFPSVVSPFSPPFSNNEIVSVGLGGQLTLRLSHYALPQAGAPEIGVFANVGLIDTTGSGQAGSPAGAFGIDPAIVDVSEDGVNWTTLGEITFDIPTNGFTDLTDPYSAAPGALPSDFQQPFTGSLSSFNGLAYSHPTDFDILDLLAGSGGGMWLDISASGLAQVGYIRFSVADDMSATNFELDAVSIAHASLGGRVPEPAAMVLIGTALSATLLRRRRLRRCQP